MRITTVEDLVTAACFVLFVRFIQFLRFHFQFFSYSSKSYFLFYGHGEKRSSIFENFMCWCYWIHWVLDNELHEIIFDIIAYVEWFLFLLPVGVNECCRCYRINCRRSGYTYNIPIFMYGKINSGISNRTPDDAFLDTYFFTTFDAFYEFVLLEILLLFSVLLMQTEAKNSSMYLIQYHEGMEWNACIRKYVCHCHCFSLFMFQWLHGIYFDDGIACRSHPYCVVGGIWDNVCVCFYGKKKVSTFRGENYFNKIVKSS